MPDPSEPLLEFEFDSLPQSPPAAPGGQPLPATHTTVYTFVVWDHDKRTTTIYPRMATRETIAMMRGKVNEETAWVVEASALDAEGFYRDNPASQESK